MGRMATQTPAKTVAPKRPSPVINIGLEDDDILVTLIGVDYTVHMPKTMLAMELAERIGADEVEVSAVVKEVHTFIDMVFDFEDAAAVKDRLLDPADRLDIKHIMRLLTALSARVTGDTPPTS